MPRLRDGEHVVAITATELGESSTGKPFVLVRFETPDGGAHHSERYYITERAIWRASALLTAIGVAHEGYLDEIEVALLHCALSRPRLKITIGRKKPEEYPQVTKHEPLDEVAHEHVPERPEDADDDLPF